MKTNKPQEDILLMLSETGNHVLSVTGTKVMDITLYDALVHMNVEQSFTKRLTTGFKYIFGIKDKKDSLAKFNFNREDVGCLIELATKLNSNNGYVRHAMREFELAKFADDKMSTLMATQMIELLAVFASHGHSGFSSGMAINLFTKLARFEIISPLTLKDDEFSLVDKDENMYQNSRDGRVFKDDKGIYFIDAYAKKIKSSKFLDEDKITPYNGGSWSGVVFEAAYGKATGKAFRRCNIKAEDIEIGWTPKETIQIPVTQIEVKSEDFLMFVDNKSSALKELIDSYDIDWFEVEGITGKPIISLTDNYGY